MTNSTKNQILARLKQSRPMATTQPKTRPLRSKPVIDIARFTALLEQNHAEVHQIPEAQLNQRFSEWLDSEKLTGSLVISNHAALKQLKPTLSEGLAQINLERLDKETLFSSVSLSVCYADAGIADKGALIIKASAHQPRTLSLVPPVNILIVKQNTIGPDLLSAVDDNLFSSEPLPSNIVIISGPSKTADIQQTLAYGAHGPKRLVVFLLT